MQLIKKPSTYTFAGNCEKIEVKTSILAQLRLDLDGVELLRESYEPTAGIVAIDLTDVLLRYTPAATLSTGAIDIPKFNFTISNAEGSVSGDFYAINGGHGASSDAQTFLKQNWLTWQPQSRTTSYHAPQRLVYAAIVQCSVFVRAYFADKSTSQAEHSKLVAGKLYTIDTTYGTIRGLFAQQPVSFDIWVEGVGVKGYPQRYYLATEDKNSDVFLWRNSIGGIDTVSFVGDRIEKHNSESSAALFGNTEIEYDLDAKKLFLKYTGYIADQNERLWVLDFFNSPERYHIDQGAIRRVVVTKPKLEHTRGDLAGYEFEFAHGDQSIYLNLPKVDTPELLEIIDPSEELFFLAPRLNQFAAAEMGVGDILIPCQYAGADKWLYVTVADIISNSGSAGGSGAGGPIKTLAPIGAKYIDGTLTITHNLAPADVSKFGTADKTGHAMVAPHPYGGSCDLDFAAKIASAIKLLLTDEASSPDYVKALTGFSLKKNEYNKWGLEIDNISVRESLSVPEFIKNRITVTNNQMWIADNGIVDDVAEITGSPGERLITVAQDKGGGSTFLVDDLLRGLFLDEKNGSLNFQTVLFTVRQVISPYVLRVSIDENTPPPRKDLIIVRTGNRTNAERQNSIFIDAARPAMFFYVNVDSHQISERNIAQATGNLQGMNFGKITNYKPITERFSSIMRGDNYIAGRLTCVSDDGLEYRVPVDRGEWMAGTYYHYDRVSCDGAMWDCAVTKTTTRPATDALDWTKRVSKGDHGAKGDYPRYVYLWSDTDTDHPPVRPVGSDPAGWAWNNSREYYIVNSLGQIVTDQSGRAITGRYSSSYRLWASVAYFSGVDDTLIGEWGVPYVQSGLDGRKGKDGIGKDGKSYEYIYRRTTTDVTPATPETAQQDEWTPDQWTDDPMGVDASNLYEWISQRVKTDGAWSVFSTPSLWAKFGKNGNDGKDVAPDTVDKIYSEIDKMAHGFGFDTAMALSEYLKLPMGKIFDYNAATGILKLSTLIAKRIATDEAFVNELVITRLRSTGGLVLLDDTQAQFGALRIKTEDGSVSVLDAQGVERVNIKSGNIDSLDTLKNGDSAIGPIYNDSATFLTSTTTELPNKIIVTKNASTLKVLASLNASATIHTSKPISLPYAIITLVLTKNGADFRTLGRAAHDETNHDITGEVGANWSGTVDAGTYGLRLTTLMSQASLGTNTSAQVSQSSMQAGYVERVMRTQIGANGIFSYWNSNKYLYAAENGNGDVFLEVKGKTDMSGVLAKARVNIYGFIDKQWGAYSISGIENTSGGEANRRVYHNFPQSGYTAIVTAIGRNAVANVIEEYPNYVDIYATGAFNISLTGDNQ